MLDSRISTERTDSKETTVDPLTVRHHTPVMQTPPPPHLSSSGRKINDSDPQLQHRK